MLQEIGVYGDFGGELNGLKPNIDQRSRSVLEKEVTTIAAEKLVEQ